ncbi:MAG: leucine-rich repeat protein, partial [Erysipelotrichaceae bacterium]
ILEKSENGNFGTVQVGNDDVNNNAIPKSTVGTIVIPNEISDVNGGKYKVTSIGEFAFFNCSSITSTGLENNTTINSIGAKAFKDCSSLTSTGLEKNSTITS